MSIKVLLADGNAVMRPVIAKVLREEPAVELVGEATNLAETLQMTAALKPDVLLLELHFDDDSLGGRKHDAGRGSQATGPLVWARGCGRDACARSVFRPLCGMAG